MNRPTKLLDELVSRATDDPDGFAKQIEHFQTLWSEMSDDASVRELLTYAQSNPEGPAGRCLKMLAVTMLHDLVIRQMAAEVATDNELEDLEAAYESDPAAVPALPGRLGEDGRNVER